MSASEYELVVIAVAQRARMPIAAQSAQRVAIIS